jgi:hypothetical protein
VFLTRKRLTHYFHSMDSNMRSDVSSANASTELAPWLPIPSRAVSAIEHPCIIKNVDKGITSLGGSVKLGKVRGQAADPRSLANAHSRV